ncbi:28S ribosomal protein S31, mitochondrial [Diachasma alloeum]|uniref:28S ribosomal protein S31, mitochondrial n=1 Tax=Diachasma alloeum TaxID=454923 RepID=UPI0007384CE6|nr:28S ribosomal protein S31, mitochondrial [Diachasma alloeum]XP_015119392.1 28S ribosomal protein S31, mitochondrial [Diachasma alloeum]XP_015119393.1 28S ribosomal protein S31, mitochondrial [Diachasma alloeum]
MDRILAVRLLCRVSAARSAVTKQFHSSVRLLSAKDSSSSSDSSDSDADKSKKIKQKNERDETAKQQTVDLLNNLLAKMDQENLVNKTIDLALPAKKPAPKKVKEKTLEEKIKIAAKDVAQTLGGDTQKKEAELLDKIFSAGAPPPPPVLPIPPVKKSKKKKKQKKEMEAVPQKTEEVMAKEEKMPQKTEEVTTKQEKVSQETEEVTAKQEKVPEKKDEVPEPSLSELLAAMKIDRTPKQLSEEDVLPFARAEKIRELAHKFQPRGAGQDIERFAARARREVVADLYAGKPFGILGGTSSSIDAITTKLNTWEALEKQELKLMISHPPENYFEELIQWTQRGILWKFPIDNEQGMEAEQSVHFSEHVFLGRHIEDWCPRKGPIRHFMELVCTGLSKNPYMTVEEKKEHIMWFKNYFGDKQQLLKDIGAIDQDILPEGESQKQIQA